MSGRQESLDCIWHHKLRGRLWEEREIRHLYETAELCEVDTLLDKQSVVKKRRAVSKVLFQIVFLTGSNSERNRTLFFVSLHAATV